MQTNQSYESSGFVLDMSSYTRIFENYYRALVFFAQRLMKDRQHAEDIVSEIFVRLWERRAGFTSEKSAKAFLYISTRNACFNSLKKIRNTSNKQKQFCALLDKTGDYVLNQITRVEVLREIHCQVQGLPPECRKITLMRILGRQNDQIAKELNISISTVKNQYARAVYLIRKKIHTEKGGKPYR